MLGAPDQLPLFQPIARSDDDEPAELLPGPLDRLSRAAADHARAVRKLEVAICAARRAGCSWRTIGRVAGLPFQTLARRYGRQATFSPTGGPGSDAA